MDTALQEIRERIVAANAAKTPLRICGGGTKDWYGQNLQGDVLDTRAYAGIVSYEPTELVITVRCGTPLADVEAKLAEQNQMFAFEPPHFGTGATVGGMVASGLSGPRRQAAGAVRDFILGAALMNGQGQLMHFGGQVMKNVAGYDVSRLLAGSLGTLGLIAEVSLKVLPKPLMESTLQFAMNQQEALSQLNQWGGQPLPISASAWHDGVLRVRLSGAEAAIHAARIRMGGEELADASAYWTDLREQRHAFFQSVDVDKGLWRLSVPSTATPLALPGEQLIEWGGAQRWLKTVADAAAIRNIAQQAGGHASLFWGGAREAGVFHPLAPVLAKIHRQLKSEFDPAGIFNPGRMYKEW
ncbi:MAG: glycolate oxidase subunit GlcE [Burkholderiaceae bacterium]